MKRLLIFFPIINALLIIFNLIFLRVASSDKITGVLITDLDGLCITANGIADKNLAPSLLKIVQSAKKLDEAKQDSMVIRIDCVDHVIDVKNMKNTITALYKRY